jgi:hypothetical protein
VSWRVGDEVKGYLLSYRKTAKGRLPNVFSSLKIEPPARINHQFAAQQDDLAVRPLARALPDRFEHLESRGSLDRVNPDALGGVS